MKPKGIIPGITALCAILGMLIGVQYNTVQSQAARQNCWQLTKRENQTVRHWNLYRKKMRNSGLLQDCQNRQVLASS